MHDGRLSIDYLGHATLLVELDGVRVLTDPVLRDRIGPLARVGGPYRPRSAAGIDIALVSHLHHDHLDLPSLVGLGPAVRVVAPAGSGGWLRARGVADVVELGRGDVALIDGLSIRAVPARHSRGRAFDLLGADALGYVIEGSRSVYFAGDTGFFPALAGLAGRVDVALLPVGGWGPTLRATEHLDPSAAALAAALIRPRLAVPMHWGTFWPSGFGWLRPARRTEPPIEFERATAELAPSVRVAATAIGETVRLA